MFSKKAKNDRQQKIKTRLFGNQLKKRHVWMYSAKKEDCISWAKMSVANMHVIFHFGMGGSVARSVT